MFDTYITERAKQAIVFRADHPGASDVLITQLLTAHRRLHAQRTTIVTKFNTLEQCLASSDPDILDLRVNYLDVMLQQLHSAILEHF